MSSPALTQAAPPPQPLGPAALAAAFVRFLLAVIAHATLVAEQMVPRTRADRAKLRRLHIGLRLAHAMIAIFGAVPTGPAEPAPEPTDAATSPWGAAVAWTRDQPPRAATLFAAEPPPFPGATRRAPVPLHPLVAAKAVAAPLPHSAHDPPWSARAVPTHHPSSEGRSLRRIAVPHAPSTTSLDAPPTTVLQPPP